MSESRYVVRPKADLDLDDQAYYYATVASPDLGHRFLLAAHDTFALLATQPNMGWRPRLRHPGLETMRVFRVRGSTEFWFSTSHFLMVLKSSASSMVPGVLRRSFVAKA